jgi:hypothetical protein
MGNKSTHAHEDDVRAFEDFQRHQRHEYEAARCRLRQQVMEHNRRNLYRYDRDGVIEPLFTVNDRLLLGAMRVYA